MGHKFCHYVINSNIDEVWNGTLHFWQLNRGKILDQYISENQLYRKLIVRHGMTLGSFGETYKIILGYHPYENITFVAVEIKLMFGTGLQWLKPVELMKRWSFEMRINPMKLSRRKNQYFEENFIEICSYF